MKEFKYRPCVSLGELICRSIDQGADTGITVQTYLNDDPDSTDVDPLGDIKADKWERSAAAQSRTAEDIANRQAFEEEVEAFEQLMPQSETTE